MFNRKIQVGLVKPSKSNDDGQPRESFAARMHITSIHTKKLVREVGVCVAGYVVLDTFRKVMIEQAKHPRV